MAKFWIDIKSKGILCRKCGKTVYEGIKTSYIDEDIKPDTFGEYCKKCNTKLNKMLNGKVVSFKSMKEFEEYLMIRRL